MALSPLTVRTSRRSPPLSAALASCSRTMPCTPTSRCVGTSRSTSACAIGPVPSLIPKSKRRHVSWALVSTNFSDVCRVVCQAVKNNAWGRRTSDAIACEVSGTRVHVPLPTPYRTRVAEGETVTIGLRPEHVCLTPTSAAPGVPCTVDMAEVSVSDAAQILHLRHGDKTFCAKIALQQPVRPRETHWLH